MLFPKNSAFTPTEDQKTHLDKVRERALSPQEQSPDINDQIRREAEQIMERHELDREQLPDKMDN